MSHHHRAVRDLPIWLSTLGPKAGPETLLRVTVDVCLHRRTWQARQTRMGEMWGVSRRTIIRWHQELQRAGLLKVIRRGRRLTNVYRLAKWLWERLTTRPKPPLSAQLAQQMRLPGVIDWRAHELKKAAALEQLRQWVAAHEAGGTA